MCVCVLFFTQFARTSLLCFLPQNVAVVQVFLNRTVLYTHCYVWLSVCVHIIYVSISFSSSIFHSFFLVQLYRAATITHLHIFVLVSFALELWTTRDNITHRDLIRPYIFNKIWPA